MPSLTVFEHRADRGGEGGWQARVRPRRATTRARLALSVDGSRAAVSIQGTNAIAWVDLAEIQKPRLIARRRWGKGSNPDAVRFDRAGGVLAVDEAEEALWYQASPQADPVLRPIEGGIGEAIEIPGPRNYWALSLPIDSGIGLVPATYNAEHDQPPALLPLKGRANLASTRPLGLAYDANRGLLAVANRSGGSLHLVRLARGVESR